MTTYIHIPLRATKMMGHTIEQMFPHLAPNGKPHDDLTSNFIKQEIITELISPKFVDNVEALVCEVIELN